MTTSETVQIPLPNSIVDLKWDSTKGVVVATLVDGSTQDLDITELDTLSATVSGLVKKLSTISASQQSEEAAVASLKSQVGSFSSNLQSLITQEQALKTQLENISTGTTTTGSGSTTTTGSGSTTSGSGTVSGGTTTTSGGGSASGGGTPPTTPTGNPDNMVFTSSGTYTFSNRGANEPTPITVIGAKNSKSQYLKWSINSPGDVLSIDYAGYVRNVKPMTPGTLTFSVTGIDTVGNSILTQKFSIEVLDVSPAAPTFKAPAYTGLPTSGVIQTPSFNSGSIVGVNILNATGGDQAANYLRWTQFFKQGNVPSAKSMVLAGTANVDVQMDVQNTYSDGSVKSAIMTAATPVVKAGNTNKYILQSGGSAGTALNAATAFKGYALTVDLTFYDLQMNATKQSIDIGAAIQSALTAGNLDYWRNGDLAVEFRVNIPVKNSLYINADCTAYVDGTVDVDIQFNNDLAMTDSYAWMYTDGVITQNGEVAYQWNHLFQEQYQDWHIVVGTKEVSVLRLQIDPRYLHKAGAIQPYNWSMGVDASIINNCVSSVASSDWGSPLGVNAVTVGMPGTGDRPDIGYETGTQSAWIVCQDPRLTDYIFGQADTAGSTPWNFYDASHGRYVNTEDYPNLWCDGRSPKGTPGDSTSQGLVSNWGGGPQGWALDPAHMPDLNFVAYMLRGSRWDYDHVMAQACFSITDIWQPNRIFTTNWNNSTQKWKNINLYSNQVRACAWELREWSNAWFIAKDKSFYQSYFEDVITENANYFNMRIQYELKPQQGDTYGYIAMAHGKNSFAPWEQNYLMPICALAGMRGFSGMTDIAKFFGRFTAESFQPQTDGPYKGANWSPFNGNVYNLQVGSNSGSVSNSAGVSGDIAQTWAEIEYWTVVGGQSDAGDTYDKTTDTVSVTGKPTQAHANGDYGMLCGCALIWGQILGIPNSQAGYVWLTANSADFGPSVFPKTPKFSFEVQ